MVKRELQRLLGTLAFLTTLPVRGFGPGGVTLGLPYFPLAGLVIGAALVLVRSAAADLSPALVPVALTLAWLLLTGGLHVDGLMDTADGLFSRRDREVKLDIMRDSRVGSFGVIAGSSLIVFKFHLFGLVTPPALLMSPVAARLGMALSLSLLPPARDGGLARFAAEGSRKHDGLLAASFGAAIALVAPGEAPRVMAALLFTALFGLWVRASIGGVTGDTLGAAGELSEAFYLALAAASLPL